ncbi:uncharacterized protein LOC117893612 [Drosophila subobscura]|uniref:uncharacterized protein LOC117893612 n=1 Tax=Drosophila subobscura TaxID=7241 RepID=UPI00155A381D|nr:uncharacterized protein LOC117893612 [Drosophila subobscura]
MDFQTKYSKRHLNGTIYIATRRVLEEKQRSELESGAGELYLWFKAPFAAYDIEQIAQVASELGEIYVIRFKVDFRSESRGYAFLQYIDASLQAKALEVLKQRFRDLNLDINILPSRNCRELVMITAAGTGPTPLKVYQQMLKICSFNSVRVYEYRPHTYMHVFSYVNNEAATLAFRDIRANILRFGHAAHVSWLRTNQTLDNDDFVTDCCQQLDSEMKPESNAESCNCFTFSRPQVVVIVFSEECQQFQGNATTCGIMQLNECKPEQEEEQQL